MRYLFPLLLGLAGCAILIGLGRWQLDRLAWKEAMLAEIAATIGAPPGPLPPLPADPSALKYAPVETAGATTGQDLLVLSGKKDIGAGYEVVSAFETGAGRRILLDRGFVPEAGRPALPLPAVPLIVSGNLHWPQETDGYTPPPDAATGLWFARDVPAMAAALGTEPVLLVAARIEGETQGITPRPIGVEGIPNDHRNYAITWFSLAAVWAGMTVLLLWRIRRQRI